MNPLVMQAINAISDGLVLVSGDGVVRLCNSAAQTMLSARAGVTLESEPLRNAISSAHSGATRLPVSLSVRPSNDPADVLRATILPSPTGRDYLLLLRDETQAAVYETTLRNVFEVINHDLRAPLEQFVATTRVADWHADEATRSTIHGAATELADRLGRLADLGEVWGADELVADERIVLAEIINEVWLEAESFAERTRVSVSLKGFGNDLAPIYGSRVWLRRALREYLENAIADAAPGTNIDLQARQVGTHVMIVVQDFGHSSPPRLKDRVFLPFHRDSRKSPSQMRNLGVGLALCRRIIELHGGHVRTETDGAGETQFVLELPTGAPSRPQPRVDILQAQRYAEDMAKLLTRRAAAKAAQPSKPNPQPAR